MPRHRCTVNPGGQTRQPVSRELLARGRATAKGKQPKTLLNIAMRNYKEKRKRQKARIRDTRDRKYDAGGCPKASPVHMGAGNGKAMKVEGCFGGSCHLRSSSCVYLVTVDCNGTLFAKPHSLSLTGSFNWTGHWIPLVIY